MDNAISIIKVLDTRGEIVECLPSFLKVSDPLGQEVVPPPDVCGMRHLAVEESGRGDYVSTLKVAQERILEKENGS